MNLEFTVEIASDFLPFLDVQVKLEDDHFDLSVYRKSTNTNVLLNFNAITPNKWKSSLICCLLLRAWKICSSTELFSDEVDKLCKIFCQNGYPMSYFDSVYKRFYIRMRNVISNSSIDEESYDFVIKLPYIGKASKTFAKKLSDIVFIKFNVKIHVVYKSCKMSSFFSLKDITPFALTSKVVYQYKCFRDENITYIGETTRPLEIRVEEHMPEEKQKTAVGKHIAKCDSCRARTLALSDFRVLKKCRTNGETRIMEALLIKRKAPVINRQLHLSGASFILTVY
jgi:hypothetical protein